MSVIGSLAVNITATTDRFVKGMQTAQGSINKFVGNLTGLTGGIGGLQGALVGLGAYGFASAIKGAVEMGDALGDMAANLSMSVEPLQALNFAVEQLGGNQEGLHAGLRSMRNLLGDAARGGDKAADAFAAIGLSSKELLGMPIEQQFMRVIEGLHNIGDGSTQASMAQDIFGKGAKELMSTIKGGTPELLKFSDELARFGGILSTEQIDKLGEANNALKSLSTQWTALKNRFAAEIAPGLVVGTHGIIDGIVLLETTFYRVQRGIVGGFEKVSMGMRTVAEGLNYILPKFAEFDVNKFDSYVDNFAGTRETLGETIRKREAGEFNNPLRGGSKKVEENTATTNDKLDRLIDVTQSRGPQLQVAGVR